MRVAVLFEDYANLNGHYLKNQEQPRNVAFYDKNNVHTYDHIQLHKTTAVQKIHEMSVSKKYDVYINLCEGLSRDCSAGEEIVRTLHQLNLPYTGADPAFYGLSKLGMKVAANSCGVKIPDHVFVDSLEDLEFKEQRLKQLPMPSLVKHPDGHDSLGLTKNSRVETFDELFEQSRQMIIRYGGCLVEQFVNGAEYTVLVVENPDDNNEPYVLMPVQCQFPPNCTFKYFDLKWSVQDDLKWRPLNGKDEKDLAEKLKREAKIAFLACSANGYGRCDFRVDSKTGEPYLLEINANCSIFYATPEDLGSADQILTFDPLGHFGFIELILKGALKRHERRKPYIRTEYKPNIGFYIAAAKNYKKGELVCPYEMNPVLLMSKKHLQQYWTLEKEPLKRDWFNRYAFAIGPDLYQLWPDDPNSWKPVNHSCDPNSWLDGLDLIARYPIKKGEEITMDYATYAYLDISGGMNEFECHCKSADCRKIIRPSSDYKLPGFKEKYQGHVSSYVEHLTR